VKFGPHLETRRKTRARESSRQDRRGLRVRISLRPTQLRGLVDGTCALMNIGFERSMHFSGNCVTQRKRSQEYMNVSD